MVLAASFLMLALCSCADTQGPKTASQPVSTSQPQKTTDTQSVPAQKLHPFTLTTEDKSNKLSPQAAANMGGEWALALCGMNLAESAVELTYEPSYDRAFFTDKPIPNYQGAIKTEEEYLEYNIDAQTGALYAIQHCPYSEAAGIGSADHSLTKEERQEALQKLTDFFERQGKEFTLVHTQWGKFYGTFRDGGGFYAWCDKYPSGIFVSELNITPSDDEPYPKTQPGLQFLEDSRPLKGVNGLDDQGTWALTPREAYQTAAKLAKAASGMEFDQMEAYAFGNGRNPESPQFYGTCVFSDGVTANPEHLVYASDAVSKGYYEATWSVDAATGHILHLYVSQAHIGFPSEAFKDVAQKRAKDVLDALGIQGEFNVVEIGDSTITVTDPEAAGHTYELMFYDTEGYAFSGLWYW